MISAIEFLRRVIILFSIRKFTLERSFLSVRNAGKRFVIVGVFLFIREFILGRSFTCVSNVGKFFFRKRI